MKSNIIKSVMLVVLTIMLSQISQAQFNKSYMGLTMGRTDLTPLPVSAIGVGPFTNAAPPLARLHVNFNTTTSPNPINGFSVGNLFRTDGRENVENNWTLFTGNISNSNPYGTEKFKLFVNANESIVRLQATQFNTVFLQNPRLDPVNEPNSAITFNVGNNEERMRITHTSNDMGETFSNRTRVGISVIPSLLKNPMSALHIGSVNPFDYAGHRAWMDVGTYYKFGKWDNMYVGLKQSEEFPNGDNNPNERGNNSDHLDAIINWGDNNYYSTPTSQPNSRYLGDHLRFVFTADQNLIGVGQPGTVSGLEVARFTPFGNMGIGNNFNSFREPVRRLEILEDELVDGGQPQFRLTHTKVNNGTASGTFVDFQATSLGDLAIFPFENTNPRNVGIGVVDPTHTLDVNGRARIRTIDQNENLTRILVADGNGVVHWRDASTIIVQKPIIDTLLASIEKQQEILQKQQAEINSLKSLLGMK